METGTRIKGGIRILAFTLDHLSSVQFEEFCYDLLSEMGFVNLSWRKGTGHDTSTSDQGRDIEAERINIDVDGKKNIEKWYVQCKHYKSGVPPEQLLSILTWATAGQPDRVLIIASNFLSNPSKNYIEQYIQENRPKFRIKIWEKPDLEQQVCSKPRLIKKYEIPCELSFIKLLHPAHFRYIKNPAPNTLNYFFNILDFTDSVIRDKMMEYTYRVVINPRIREPKMDDEQYGDLFLDEINYDAFKSKLFELRTLFPDQYLIESVIHKTLQYLFSLGDSTSMDEIIKKRNQIIRFEEYLFSIETDRKKQDELKKSIDEEKEAISRIPHQTEEYYNLYIKYCVDVVDKLYNEKFDFLVNIKIDKIVQKYFESKSSSGL